MKIRFEWDFEKAEINLKKHKVSFEEAESVFLRSQCNFNIRSGAFG